MAKTNWDATNIPDQKDRVVIITGATSGLGKEAARVLAGKNASVIMAVRNVEKAEGVASEIRKLKNLPSFVVEVSGIDSERSCFAYTLLFAYQLASGIVVIRNDVAASIVG